MATERFTISQCDDSDEWLVLRDETEVVASFPFDCQAAAENERDYRNAAYWEA